MAVSAPGGVPVGNGIPVQWRRYALKGLLLTAVIGVLVAIFTVDEGGWTRLREFPPAIACALVALVFIAWICNGSRTWILARALGSPISLRKSIGIILSMEFAIAATPGGVGGLATRVGLQRQAGIPLPRTMTMIAADISADILFFALLAPFALRATLRLAPVQNLIEAINWWSVGALAMGILVLLGIASWALFRGHGRLLLRGVPSRWRERAFGLFRWKRLLCKLRLQGREMRVAVGFLLRRRRASYFAAFALAAVQWVCRYSVLPVVLWGLGTPVDPLALMFVQGMLFLTGLLVVAPGGGGSLEILTTLILQPLVGTGQAALAVILWRVFTYYLYLAGGAGTFIAMLWCGSKEKGAVQRKGPRTIRVSSPAFADDREPGSMGAASEVS